MRGDRGRGLAGLSSNLGLCNFDQALALQRDERERTQTHTSHTRRRSEALDERRRVVAVLVVVVVVVVQNGDSVF